MADYQTLIVETPDAAPGVTLVRLNRPEALNAWTPNPDALCSLLTWQYPLVEAFFRRRLLAWGNVPLAFRFSYLFEN